MNRKALGLAVCVVLLSCSTETMRLYENYYLVGNGGSLTSVPIDSVLVGTGSITVISGADTLDVERLLIVRGTVVGTESDPSESRLSYRLVDGDTNVLALVLLVDEDGDGRFNQISAVGDIGNVLPELAELLSAVSSYGLSEMQRLQASGRRRALRGAGAER